MREPINRGDAELTAQELLHAGAVAELRLLKHERKAERRLAKARAALAEDEARLRQMTSRVEKSLAAVAAAEAAVREAQALRAAGPPASPD